MMEYQLLMNFYDNLTLLHTQNVYLDQYYLHVMLRVKHKLYLNKSILICVEYKK